MILFIHFHRITHFTKQNKLKNDYPRPISITYLNHKSRNNVIRSLHLLNQSKFPVKFFDPLNNSLIDPNNYHAINNLNSTHPHLGIDMYYVRS